MDTLVTDRVRARIAKPRAADLLARGWTILGPAGEGMLLMEGPDPDLEPTPAPSLLAAFARPLLSRARTRALARAGGSPVFGAAA
ncbi:hypothetical protein [Azospirillum halopraeferens]|uniref:hypothetical protein n=1 Tax=Azospirillum halopraeferens TaxID=34010 RepID=UPI0004163C44|nr:hypothetical protein [Azospirillum halopraeferens]